MQYSGTNYSSSYSFSYINNQNNLINSTLNRNTNEIINVYKNTDFTGTKFYLETGSGIITGIQTLIRDTGLWIVTGKFTGNLSGSIYGNEYIFQDEVITTGSLFGSGFALGSISGDSFTSSIPFTGTIEVNQTYAIASYTGIQASGTYFLCNTSNFYITGINVTGEKLVVGNYTGTSSGLILQANPDGSVLSVQPTFITSGGYQFVTGYLGQNSSPIVYATGIFTFTTGNILTNGYLTGVPQYVKDFTGMFNISTGIFDENAQTTYYTGLSYNKSITGYSGTFIYNTGTTFNIKIDYTPFIDYSPLIGLLTLSGTGNTVFTTLVTGI